MKRTSFWKRDFWKLPF